MVWVVVVERRPQAAVDMYFFLDDLGHGCPVRLPASLAADSAPCRRELPALGARGWLAGSLSFRKLRLLRRAAASAVNNVGSAI